MPHFKGQLGAPRASHEWAKGIRDQLFGRAGQAIVNAITEHVDEPKAGQLMRGSVLRDGRMVYRDDLPEPVPEPGQVLVGGRGVRHLRLRPALRQTRRADVLPRPVSMLGTARGAGVCRRPGDDVFMGHEFSAEILEAGPDTEAPAAGTLVTSVPVLLSPTGVEMIVYSNTTLGGYAERMLLSAPLLLPVPNGLDARHAALTEPMAVGLHAVNKSTIEPGETALVSAAARSASPSSPRCGQGRGNHCGVRLLVEAPRAGGGGRRAPRRRPGR